MGCMVKYQRLRPLPDNSQEVLRTMGTGLPSSLPHSAAEVSISKYHVPHFDEGHNSACVRQVAVLVQRHPMFL